jgi:hypothetical protein
MMELLLPFVGNEKKTFCRAFENLSKYTYCRNVHNRVLYSCLFGVRFVSLWSVQSFC